MQFNTQSGWRTAGFSSDLIRVKEVEPESDVETGCCWDWLLVHECTHVITCTEKKEGKKAKQENT